MPDKIHQPPSLDLSLETQRLARELGVSIPTVRRWKARAGHASSVGHPPGLKPETVAAWSVPTDEDWRKGDAHVGKIMNVARQSAYRMRHRLIRWGRQIPKAQRAQSASLLNERTAARKRSGPTYEA